jgi:3-isopropylmalate/(R)-2-methylmalate dehydratase small subunit
MTHVRATRLEPVSTIIGTAVPFDYSSVDTDAIFPVSADALARREGFGRALFARWRTDPDFILNRPVYADATVLVAGPDFGVGSSRETAVWALTGAGFRAVIAPSFGDIFRANCPRNRLLAATIDAADGEKLRSLLRDKPGTTVHVDVEAGLVTAAAATYPLGIPGFARELLVRGIDEMDLLRERQQDIDELLARRRQLARPTTDVDTITVRSQEQAPS